MTEAWENKYRADVSWYLEIIASDREMLKYYNDLLLRKPDFRNDIYPILTKLNESISQHLTELIELKRKYNDKMDN